MLEVREGLSRPHQRPLRELRSAQGLHPPRLRRHAKESPDAQLDEPLGLRRLREEGEPTTDDELAALRKLSDEATPGPWAIDVNGTVCESTGPKTICRTGADGDDLTDELNEDDGQAEANYANAALIAAARNALPALLDEIDRLRSRSRRLEELERPETR